MKFGGHPRLWNLVDTEWSLVVFLWSSVDTLLSLVDTLWSVMDNLWSLVDNLWRVIATLLTMRLSGHPVKFDGYYIKLVWYSIRFGGRPMKYSGNGNPITYDGNPKKFLVIIWSMMVSNRYSLEFVYGFKLIQIYRSRMDYIGSNSNRYKHRSNQLLGCLTGVYQALINFWINIMDPYFVV